MNYLAHLHLASKTKTSLKGAILGDVVKGSRYLELSKELQVGVRLHRKIDSYTEEHILIKKAKSLFPRSERRFAGIALDVFWDHCLAKNFEEFSKEPLASFVKRSYLELQETPPEFDESYHRIISFMTQYDWLNSYVEFDGLRNALIGISRRRDSLSPVKNCISSIERHYDELVSLFPLFYPHLESECHSWVKTGFEPPKN